MDGRGIAGRSQWQGILALALLVAALGAYATWLNAEYYRRFAPFWDSVSYSLKLAQVMDVAREQGVDDAVSARGVTVWLQWAQAALMGAAGVKPSRAAGVWVQAVWLVAMAGSLYLMLRRVKGASATIALAATIPFLAIHGIWRVNGGLSDFKFDLGLYVWYATACAWYLMARESRHWLDWTLLGLSVGLACLARATAPVYFLASLGPVVLWDVWTARGQRSRFAAGAALAVTVATITCGWFFVANRQTLLSYYVFSGQHANWNWPITESVRHLAWGIENVGWPAGIGAAAIGAMLLRRAAPNEQPWWKRLDGATLWLAVAPAVVMMAKGAGPNPFVTMPCAFGILMLLTFPLRGRIGELPRGEVRAVMAVAVLTLATALGISAYDHIARTRHRPTMNAHRQVVDAILADAQQRKSTDVVVSVWSLSQISNEGVLNVLLFDYGFDPGRGRTVTKQGLTVRAPYMVQAALEEQWRKLPGKDDPAKIRRAVESAATAVDYLVVPDETTAQYLQSRLPNPLHRRLAQMLNELAARGGWDRVGSPIPISDRETYQVYRNTTPNPRAPEAQSGGFE